MSLCSAPAFSSATPNASRVALPIFIVFPSLFGSAGVQQRQGLLLLVLGQRLAVVVGVLGQDRLDRPALDGPGDDDARPALGRGGLPEGGQHLLEVVAVD